MTLFLFKPSKLIRDKESKAYIPFYFKIQFFLNTEQIPLKFNPY